MAGMYAIRYKRRRTVFIAATVVTGVGLLVAGSGFLLPTASLRFGVVVVGVLAYDVCKSIGLDSIPKVMA